jgi:hypothetical protein
MNMSGPEHMIFGRIINVKHFSLMLVLFGLLLFCPIIPYTISSTIFLTALILSAWLASGANRKSRIATLLLGTLAAVVILAEMLAPNYYETMSLRPLGQLTAVTILVLLFYCGGAILWGLMNTSRISADEVIGTINLYLILGFIWAYAFAFFELHDPHSFNLIVQHGHPSVELIYFSFVTLTTLGYGDITPLTPTVRMLAVIEAIVGQFYVAIVVTYLLSLLISQKLDKESE